MADANNKISESLESLTFFLQLVCEMTDENTIDTYQHPTLNSNTLFIELVETLNSIKRNHLHQNNLVPILEELYKNLQTDLISREIFSDQLDVILLRIQSYISSHDEKKQSKILSFANHVSEILKEKYLDRTIDLIKSLILYTPREKNT